MANEIRQNTVKVPAGTSIASAVTTDLTFPPREVDAVEILIPPGANGDVGFALLNSNVRVIPYGSDKFIIASGEVINWPLAGFINSGSWQLQAYNLGTNDHSIYVRWLLSYITAPTGAAGAVVASVDSLTGPTDAGGADVSIVNGSASDVTDLSGIGI